MQISIIKPVCVIDINSAVVMTPIAMIFIYSAKKINTNAPELYSVLNPETSSDSPSDRSNGVRLVSAREVMIQVTNMGHSINMNVTLFLIINELSLSEEIIIIGDKITSAIETS